MSERELLIRYILEYAIVIPGAMGIMLPARNFLRYKKKIVIGLAALLSAVIILAGPVISCRTGIGTSGIMMPVMALLLLFSMYMIKLPKLQVLFIFANSYMLCCWSVLMTLYLFAPIEITQPDAPFMIQSGLFSLAVAFVELVLFARTLITRFPAMFRMTELHFLWNYAWLFPSVIAYFLMWVMPTQLDNVLVGRIHLIACVCWLFVLIIVYSFYLFLWYFAKKLTNERRLIEENRILEAEKIRFIQIEDHVSELRRLRHDLRQHMRVLSTMASAEQYDQMKEYLQKYVDSVNPEPASYCDNYAVDAIAAFYQKEAGDRGIKIRWNLQIPAQLELDDTELCVIIGNLLENAIKASEKVAPPQRMIEVTCRMAGEEMLMIEVRNHYKGKIFLNRDGMPSARNREGIGLFSVSNTVRKNNGTFLVDFDDEWFWVDIVINNYKNYKKASEQSENVTSDIDFQEDF